jgi:cellulose synthase/poly-beta-1,6-N-acetylglucosamine synthase-like glycosyltransferase
MTMRVLFWSSAFCVLYVYAGYMVLLMIWSRLRPKARHDANATVVPFSLPSISIVIAARNEAARLPQRIENLLSLDYPPELRQIIVVSDGSTDDTREVLSPFERQVDVLMLPACGKAAALNAGIARAKGEILVFADARQTFAPEVAKALIAPFRDKTVGAVSGELVLGCESRGGRRQRDDRRCAALDDHPLHEHRYTAERRRGRTSTVAEGVGYYWRYEKRLRRLESSVGSMIGATGAIYSMRRSLWKPLPEGIILDDVLAPMRAVLAGARVVFEPRAQAFDQAPPDAQVESRRKVRTLAGNVQILLEEPRLLIPFVNPIWLQYASHKIGRLVVPYALLLLIVSSVWLARAHPLYAFALVMQCAFYLESVYGAWLEHRHRTSPLLAYSLTQRIGKVAFTFVMMNAAAVVGLCAGLCGRRVWR